MKVISLKLINWYQSKGGSKELFRLECNFTPTCSEYTKRCIEKYGFLKGWKLGLARIRRCHAPDQYEIIEDNIP